jgi:hypothetical protein
MVILVLFEPSSNSIFTKRRLYKIWQWTSCGCDGVTQVYVRKLQKLEDAYFGKWALRSREFFRAQTPKRKLLPERGPIGPVQNMGVHQKFIFRDDIILPRYFNT